MVRVMRRPLLDQLHKHLGSVFGVFSGVYAKRIYEYIIWEVWISKFKEGGGGTEIKWPSVVPWSIHSSSLSTQLSFFSRYRLLVWPLQWHCVCQYLLLCGVRCLPAEQAHGVPKADLAWPHLRHHVGYRNV